MECGFSTVPYTISAPPTLPPITYPRVTFVSFWWCRALERLAAGNEKTRARLSLHTHNARGGEKNVFGFYRTESRHSTHKKNEKTQISSFAFLFNPPRESKIRFT